MTAMNNGINLINFLRAIEMSIEPPFKFFIVTDNNPFGKIKTCKSLTKAKEIGENLYLDGEKGICIFNVHYVDGNWNERAGWLSDKILVMSPDGTWEKPSYNSRLHTSYLWNYDVWEWDKKKYNRLRSLFLTKDYLDWGYVQKELGTDPDSLFEENFKKDFNRASSKVMRKFEEFLSANEELTGIVQRKYPDIRTQYAVFDRMLTFYEDTDGIAKEFYTLEEVDNYYRKKEKDNG